MCIAQYWSIHYLPPHIHAAGLLLSQNFFQMALGVARGHNELFHLYVIFLRTCPSVDKETWWTLLKTVWSLLMFVWISLRRIALLAKTMFMIADHYWCSAYNRLHCTDFTVDSREKLFFFLCSCRKVWITVATVYLLRLGWTLCLASFKVNPWFTTWSTNVAQISSDK